MDIDEFTKEEKESQGLCGSQLHMNSLEVIIQSTSPEVVEFVVSILVVPKQYWLGCVQC